MNGERYDVIFAVLQDMLKLCPRSGFIKSLYEQYCERGSLSKGQLEGLHNKASKYEQISRAHLATLNAIILRKRSFQRSPAIKPGVIQTSIDNSKDLIRAILSRYPAHKRITYLAEKLETGGLDENEKKDIRRIHDALFNT